MTRDAVAIDDLLALCGDSRPRSFFFHDPPTTAIYTLSLHDALPIFQVTRYTADPANPDVALAGSALNILDLEDRKSTRLNSSHQIISYAVFCLKKKTYVPPELTIFAELFRKKIGQWGSHDEAHVLLL